MGLSEMFVPYGVCEAFLALTAFVRRVLALTVLARRFSALTAFVRRSWLLRRLLDVVCSYGAC